MLNSVNTNVGAQIALQSLNKTNTELGVTQSRINTGLKVANAKDNAAIWAIAQNQRAEVAAFNSVKESLQRGQSAVDVATSAGSSISDLLSSMKQLALSASDKNLDQASRNALQEEYNSQAKQVTSYINNASFNGINLLDGSTLSYKALANSKATESITVNGENLSLRQSSATASANLVSTVNIANGISLTADQTLTITDGSGNDVDVDFTGGTVANPLALSADQVVDRITTALRAAKSDVSVELVPGANAGEKVLQFQTAFTGSTSLITATGAAGVSAGTVAAADAGTDAVGGGGLVEIQGNQQFTATTNYAAVIKQIETSIANVSAAVGRLGSGGKAMDSTLTFVSKLQDSLEAGVGNLVDADLAKESARLQALQTKQQLGVQALSIANQSSGILLGLFR